MSLATKFARSTHAQAAMFLEFVLLTWISALPLSAFWYGITLVHYRAENKCQSKDNSRRFKWCMKLQLHASKHCTQRPANVIVGRIRCLFHVDGALHMIAFDPFKGIAFKYHARLFWTTVVVELEKEIILRWCSLCQKAAVFAIMHSVWFLHCSPIVKECSAVH